VDAQTIPPGNHLAVLDRKKVEASSKTTKNGRLSFFQYTKNTHSLVLLFTFVTKWAKKISFYGFYIVFDCFCDVWNLSYVENAPKNIDKNP
jgi:hypothetical protein